MAELDPLPPFSLDGKAADPGVRHTEIVNVAAVRRREDRDRNTLLLLGDGVDIRRAKLPSRRCGGQGIRPAAVIKSDEAPALDLLTRIIVLSEAVIVTSDRLGSDLEPFSAVKKKLFPVRNGHGEHRRASEGRPVKLPDVTAGVILNPIP